ncbi:MAG TPA: FtsX-like permease family protein, partial [Micromonosporaceae bacterium]|nr:FtsX-like permease family protein [Micromonosporaceae bacterium]
MTAWTVMLRGIRYRAGRSLVVLVLATVATTAAVLAPAYGRAARQSVLTDGLAAAPANGTSVAVGADGTASGAPAAHGSTGDARAAVGAALDRHPVLRRLLGPPVAGVDTEAVLGGREPLATRLAYRDGACEHLTVVAGACPVDTGEVLVSERTAAAQGIEVGQRVPVRVGDGTERRQRSYVVTGVYVPKDTAAAYWGRTAYFTGGSATEAAAERADAVFTAAEDDVRADGSATVVLRLEYPLRTGEVRLDDVRPLGVELGSFGLGLRAADLDLDQALTATLADIDADQRAIGRTVPVIAVPLVLLCWFVLFLLVASLTEERGPEVALAKLRGYPAGRAARFGLGEVLLLVVLAAPLGVLLGLGLVELAARSVFAGGSHVELRWPVLAAAAGALAAAGGAALLAGRGTLRQPVLQLLRRVPARADWRAGVAEGAVVALAGASLFAALADQSAPLALLAPALLALLAGVVAARLLGLWSRLRLAIARRRGRVPALLSAAQLARRPAAQRVVVVVTVAIALLSFAATAWDVAATARRERAEDTVGADRVYTVTAAHPQALADAVNRADPRGRSMAVVRSSVPYGGGHVELVGVQAQLLPAVTRWRGQDGAGVQRMAAALRPALPEPLRVRDRIEVDADAGALGAVPVRLGVVVSAPGEPPRTVPLGLLAQGPRTYRGAAPGCRAGCRLLGLALSRAASGGTAYQVTLAVRGIRSGGADLDAGFANPQAWRPAVRDPVGRVTIAPGAALSVSVASADQREVLIQYGDTPAILPAVLAGAAPADDPAAAGFEFPGFAEQPQPFTVTASAARLPRAGTHGLLFDLDYAVRAAEHTASLADSTHLRYEVWAGPGAPADLGALLAAEGLAVLRTESVAGVRDQLGRRAPALGLRLYLLAAAAAVALAVGVVVL